MMLVAVIGLILGAVASSGLTLTLGRSSIQSSYVPSSSNRTVIFVNKEALPGQDLFLRGGIDLEHRPGCTDDVATDACAIRMQTHLLGTIDTYDRYNAWRVGDHYLDWHGVESGQGLFEGIVPDGTPTAWTSNNVLSPAYQELNTFGDHYWMVDMEMDCSETEDGMFEVKAYFTNDIVINALNGWEPDINQGECAGDVGGSPPYQGKNHFGKCGCINVFEFGVDACTINSFPY